MLLKLCLFFSLSCNSTEVNKDTIIIGKALNAKHSAVVVVNDSVSYYIDGMDYWDPKYYDKKVKVIGKLSKVVNEKDTTDDGLLKQAIIGTMLIIKKAKWILVN